MGNILKKALMVLVVGSTLYGDELPDLKMADSNLTFREIEGYQDYKIVATHFRKEKNELRYILANSIAYKALKENKDVMPDGSKIVKIGWSVREMPTFPSAIEADKLQRVEYMIKDKTKHKESDGWGYARFVKKEGKYEPWDKGVKECVDCHSAEMSHDRVFTRYQPMY